MRGQTVYKQAELKAAEGDGVYEFIASDETIDRYGDIVRSDGWKLDNYRRNPIVLFQHSANNPVGISQRAWVDKTNKALMARIKLAAQGTSPFIDTLRGLLSQGIIKAVSVGFAPLDSPNYLRDKEGHVTGFEFVSQELLEISLVSVPANPSALVQAKAMNIPEVHLQRLFGPPKVGASVLKSQWANQKEILSRRLGV